MKLYVCLSLYNVFITLVKSAVADERVDILLGTQTPNYQEVAEKLTMVKNVANVIIFDSVSYKKITYNNKLEKLLYQKKKECSEIERQLQINWKKYSDIYLYNDFEIIGWYLVYHKISYHLIEDGLNFFTYFDQYYQLPAKIYDRNSLSIRLKDFLNLGHRMYGTSRCTRDIEVNSIEGVKIRADNIIVQPRAELYSALTDDDKTMLFRIFCEGKNAGNSCSGRKVLLCTQPLYKDGQLKTIEEQKQVYADIIESYSSQGYTVVVKPHPRDDMDYSSLCNQYGGWVIDRFIPSEVLNFNKDIHYDLAVSITTTAIETLQFVKEKKYLGFEFLEKYKEQRH